MRQLKPVDVVIAGGGFVGLTLAKEITARTSLSVVVVERGQACKLSDYAARRAERGDQGAAALFHGGRSARRRGGLRSHLPFGGDWAGL
jgi:2-polyprenyl-6-methoxyphenol hydroxylase-like FAD-dependent oxidoreductase